MGQIISEWFTSALARDKLVEAHHFAQLANRSTVSVEDLQMTKLRRTRKLRKSEKPSERSMKLLAENVSQEYLPKPRSEETAMLPTWHNCQAGVMFYLEGELLQMPEQEIGSPPNWVAPADTSAADTSPTSDVEIMSNSDSELSSTSDDEPSSTSDAEPSSTSAAALSSSSDADTPSTSAAAISSIMDADTSIYFNTPSTSAASNSSTSDAVTAFSCGAAFSTLKFRSRSRSWTGP